MYCDILENYNPGFWYNIGWRLIMLHRRIAEDNIELKITPNCWKIVFTVLDVVMFSDYQICYTENITYYYTLIVNPFCMYENFGKNEFDSMTYKLLTINNLGWSFGGLLLFQYVKSHAYNHAVVYVPINVLLLDIL